MTAAPNFSPDGDAAVLDKAIKVKGEVKTQSGGFSACWNTFLALQRVFVCSVTC